MRATFAETAKGFSLTLQDEDCISASVSAAFDKQPAKNSEEAEGSVREQLARFGNTNFELTPEISINEEYVGASSLARAPRQQAGSYDGSSTNEQSALNAITIHWSQPWFVPSSLANKLRRDAVEQLEAARLAAYKRLPRKAAVQPPAKYPEETLSFLANVYNSAARTFYAKHGVKLIEAAYEAHHEANEVSLMITRHCIRYSLSLCPKQAKGVIGVQGQVRAEPMMLVNGSEKLRLEFDCRKCEMHVMGKMKKQILKTPPPSALPIAFHPHR